MSTLCNLLSTENEQIVEEEDIYYVYSNTVCLLFGQEKANVDLFGPLCLKKARFGTLVLNSYIHYLSSLSEEG